MHNRKIFLLGLMASLAITSFSRAQAPPIPAAPGGLAVPGAAPAAPAAAPSGNLWSFLCPTAAQKAACCSCFCNSAIGQLTSSAVRPLSMVTGGLMANCCLQNSIANDIANNSADSSQGAAARIKRDEEDAKARRAAVRYLGTVDCNYWPEAIDVLKKSLRKDPNECVRFEAALALGHGCCCNAQIVEALTICVMGSDRDRAPPERSDRVRAAAAEALAHCVLPAPEDNGKEKEKNIQKTDLRNEPKDYNAYYKKIAETPREKVVENARAVLVSMQKGGTGPAGTTGGSAAAPVVPVPAIHARPTSLSGIVANAFSPETGVGGSATSPRPPFFSGLTKALTGKQENMVPARVEPVVPEPTPPVIIREPKVLPPLPRETKATPPAEPRSPLPNGAAPAGRTPATKAVAPAPVEIKQTTPSENRVRALESKPTASQTDEPKANVPAPIEIKAVTSTGNWYRAPEAVPSVGQTPEIKANVPAPIDLQPVPSSGNWYRAPEVVPVVGQPQEPTANVPAASEIKPVQATENGLRAPEGGAAKEQPRESKVNVPASFEIKTMTPIEIGLPDPPSDPKAPETKTISPGPGEIKVVAPVDLRFPAPASNGIGGQTLEIRTGTPPELSAPVSTNDSAPGQPRESVGAVTFETKKPTIGDPLPPLSGRP